ncbi:hypothetical protein EBR43_03410 [bacterium]|nr:hypothetical protein [bacterium]
MKTTLLIDGGAGRQICAIPALEEFVDNNPDTTIITYFWTPLFWGNKKLAPRVFDNNTKGLFDRIRDSKIIKPEPYFNSNYINNKISLAQAFNEDINNIEGQVDKPRIYLTKSEKNRFNDVIKKSGKKTVLFQPFGSTATFTDKEVLDNTVRSFSRELTIKTIQTLINAGLQIALFDDREIPFIDRNMVLPIRGVGIREWAIIASQCDYYFGCDSAGQHLAYAFDKPGMVIFGGTTTINCGYPEWFTNIEKSDERSYMPYRLAEFDMYISETCNDGLMDFTKEEIDTICENLIQHIRSKA